MQFKITSEDDRAFDKMMIRTNCSNNYIAMLLKANLRAQECISSQLQKLVDALPERGRAPWPP
jgi:hypothetical protein